MAAENLNSIYTYCSVPGCKKNPKHTCFTLPREPEKAKVWCEQLGIDPNSPRKIFICEVHFEDGIVDQSNILGAYYRPPNLSENETNNITQSRSPSRRVSTPCLVDEKNENIQSKISPRPLQTLNVTENESNVNFKLTIFPPHAVSTLKVPVKKEDITLPATNLIEDESIQSSITRDKDLTLNKEVEESFTDNISTTQTQTYNDLLTDIIINTLKSSSPKNITSAAKPLDVEVRSNSNNKRYHEKKRKSTKNKKQKLHSAQVELDLKHPEYATETIKELKIQIEATSKDPKALTSLGAKIYLTYPQAYKALHDTLNLPIVTDLKNIFYGSAISIDDNTIFAQTLKYKISFMSKRDKQCILCLGETFVRKNLYYDIKHDKILGISDVNNTQTSQIADRALILTMQAIFANWKQPIAIAFVSEHGNIGKTDIRQWVHENIKNLLKLGYNVRAFVSESDYLSALPMETCKGVCKVIYDVPSLFKLLYYSFLSHDFLYTGGLVKRLHIQNFYAIDKKKHFKLCPYLTDKHMKPERVQDIDLKLVTEVINTRTAAAMHVYIDFRVLEPSAVNTVNFLTDMSTLFEILYSNNLNETHVKFLHKMLVFFNDFKLINCKTNVEVPKADTFVEKFRTTIRSTLRLYEEMKANPETESIPTRKLTLEYIESFFDRIKKQITYGEIPSCKEMYLAFRSSALTNILRPINNMKFVELKKSLNQINKIITGFQSHEYKVADVNIGTQMKISSHEYKTLNLLRKDAIVFIAGFVLKKCYDNHAECAAMKNYISIVLHDTDIICKSILGEIQEGICVVPQESFIEFVEMMEIKLRSFLSKDILETRNNRIISGLLSAMELVNFAMPCTCFPILYAKKLYLRIRMFNILKYNNTLFSYGDEHSVLVVNNL